MLLGEDVIVCLFLIELLATGIDKLDLVVCLVLRENQYVYRNAGTEEEVGRERYDRLYKVVIDKVLADLLLTSPTVEDAWEGDDSCPSSCREIVQRMEDKGKVRLAIGR